MNFTRMLTLKATNDESSNIHTQATVKYKDEELILSLSKMSLKECWNKCQDIAKPYLISSIAGRTQTIHLIKIIDLYNDGDDDFKQKMVNVDLCAFREFVNEFDRLSNEIFYTAIGINDDDKIKLMKLCEFINIQKYNYELCEEHLIEKVNECVICKQNSERNQLFRNCIRHLNTILEESGKECLNKLVDYYKECTKLVEFLSGYFTLKECNFIMKNMFINKPIINEHKEMN